MCDNRMRSCTSLHSQDDGSACLGGGHSLDVKQLPSGGVQVVVHQGTTELIGQLDSGEEGMR